MVGAGELDEYSHTANHESQQESGNYCVCLAKSMSPQLTGLKLHHVKGIFCIEAIKLLS